MNRLLLVFLLANTILVNAQSLKNIRKESYQTLVFKTDAISAEKYIQKMDIDVDAFSQQIPFCVFSSNKKNVDSLPTGHYVLLTIKDSMVEAELVNSSQLLVYPINNQKRVQIEVRDKTGKYITNAKVFLNNKLCKFNVDAQNYMISNPKPEDAFIKVYTPNDTTFLSLTEKEERYDDRSIAKQRWDHFKLTKLGKTIVWIPNQVKKLFSQKKRYKPAKRVGTRGLMVFNQPKYKLNDTVKLKAYLYDRKNKVYKKSVGVYLEYYKPSKGYVSQKLSDIKPTDNGSFIDEFLLRDSLVNDIYYNIVFKNEDKKSLLQNGFNVEDYVLDEVATYSLRSEKENYYRYDSLLFYANAKDANGLNLLDGTAKLILLTDHINEFLRDSVQVSDTLFVEEKKLETQGDTRFTIPSTVLPAANLSLKAVLIFRNSNNEIQERASFVNYKMHNNEIITKQIADTIYAEVMIDGKSVAAKGKVKTGGEIEKTESISFPFKTKIDPFAEDYYFDWVEKDSVVASKNIEVENHYRVDFSRISKEDTLGFVLHNPYKIPVNYSVFKNNQLIATGKDDKATIEWKKLINHKHQMYTVKYQYIWAGEEINYQENIGLLYKLLDVKVNTSTSVFPGQKDSIEIVVKDYKNNTASNVNLTAFSYNSQFKNRRNVPDPPYLQSYKLKPQLLYKKYEKDDAYILRKYSLGKHKQFIQKFAVDSMLYYQILFPADTIKDVVTRIEESAPQVSVHVVNNGVPQEIFILYLNNILVYYYDASAITPYVFNSLHGYNKIGIRLLNKYVEIDSVYLQPFYKHDIVFDLNKLPKAAKVSNTENYLSDIEKYQLEENLFQIQLEPKTINSFLWQGNKVASWNGLRNQLVRPFVPYDSLHFFAPGRFDMHFIFEPNYRYRISDKIVRLERNKIFPDDRKYYLNRTKSFSFVLGDTITAPPVISYIVPAKKDRFIKVDDYWSIQNNKINPFGALQLCFKKDTAFAYIILKPLSDNHRIIRSFSKKVNIISTGIYQLLLVMKDLSFVTIDSISIKNHSTLCLQLNKLDFRTNNTYLETISDDDTYKPVVNNKPIVTTQPEQDKVLPGYPAGKESIRGIVVDAKGNLPISYASVIVKGTKGGTGTNREGRFTLQNIKQGKYTIVVSAIGYMPKEVAVNILDNETPDLKIALKISNQMLEEVVVVGYGTTKKKDFSASVSSIKSIADTLTFNVTGQALQGRVAGISITNFQPGATAQIRIRGTSSLNSSNNPLVVIDGIAYDDIPKNISPEMIENVEIIKDASATAIYGSRAVNGVIVISTKTKYVREQFRDYAFWKPELISDENGRIKFSVTYPDNITSWQTYVLAMDKKLRIGKTVFLTQAYKPVMAQLSVPQFLTEGDSVNLIGKCMNYTKDNYRIKSRFIINGIEQNIENSLLQSNASAVSSASYTTVKTDTVKAAFRLQTETGFKDGEERKIPVFRKGIEENTGSFVLLNHDTTVNFSAIQGYESLKLSADNRTLDLLIKEIDHLKEYPYFCMEQTASKLSGLLMERDICKELNQPFKDEKIIKQLLSKLQKAQLYDGGWAWWENGKANFYISNYIINALLPLRADPLVETNIRNGLLYLQNQLDFFNKNTLLLALNTMASAKHAMDYTPYLSRLIFDSLSLHQQWQWINIQQKIKGDYQSQLKQLISKQKATMLGGIYWGTENYLWYNNAIATTVLAYTVLKNEEPYKNLLPDIQQYFLEMKQNGYWRNTVETASILSAILPDVLNSNKAFVKPASLSITGDTSFTISNFPYTVTFGNSIKNITVQKLGGGLTYLSLYQKWFNKTPDVVDDKFEIKTYFKKNNETEQRIKAGEKVKMIVEVNVKKDADFVMLQIPIPAGCTYASKNQDQWNMHKEFYKDRVVMFAEKLVTGKYMYEIDLEPRYTGKYILNPTKAELMYFPIFFGRNEMKKVEIY